MGYFQICLTNKIRRQPLCIVHKAQIKFNQHLYKFKPYFSLPDFKFIRQMMYGILVSRHMHLNKIGSVLNESITLKKTTERLSRHLREKDFHLDLLKAHLRINSQALNRCKYLIFDGSDISKEYAKQMEGMETVHDGDSQSGIGAGYWLCNFIATDQQAQTIIPAYSELYALKHPSEQSQSENSKIINAIHMMESELGGEHIIVFDRGGDRRILVEDRLQKNGYFIIRQTGQRNLYYQNKNMLLKDISRQVNLDHNISITKHRHGKSRKITYHCGAVPVAFSHQYKEKWPHRLWLVIAKRDGRGYVWYLSYLPAETAEQAIRITMQGYGNRWKIEEVHRHIKSEYHLESIQLRRYVSLKNFMALFWVTMILIYKEFESLSNELISESGIKVTYKNGLWEYINFIYYKITKALSWVLSKTKLLTKISYPRPPGVDTGQLDLGFF